MKKNINIGCSSFYNSYWKKIFYPENVPSAKWFDYYCTQFNTYEMNGSFYKFPTLRIMENWFKKTPENFLLSVKAPKEVTHIKKFIGCEELISNFYTVCKTGLKHKLGCILFQLPPSTHYSPEKLLLIVQSLDPNFNNVVEFRHESWWIPAVWNELSKSNITFCSVSHPQLPETIFTEFPVIYIRFHGRQKMFYSEYTSEELIAVNNIISKFDMEKKVFIYFNNTASTAGILNAMEMEKLKLK
jgi:uncharacterized protein YecE (DUF72 family)